MPILSFRVEGVTPTGEKIYPGMLLAKEMLRVPAAIWVHQSALKALSDQGTKPPDMVQGNALIDTGASITSIDLEAARKLGLPEVGRTSLGTADGPKQAPLFPFSISIPPSLSFQCPQGAGCNLRGQGIIALIGMDLLARCILIVNGPEGTCSLAY